MSWKLNNRNGEIYDGVFSLLRKTEPILARRVSVLGRRPVVLPHDDGIMTVPIAAEQRGNADAEMKDYINRLSNL